ncbi:lmtr-2, partial [Pristionchus pacificus]|uniref:Ragulator complex protein LAMTOR2 homolog n=1 Tax=Pristionchus pacificus TaxID=54126 RepID=A0A8R1Z7R3_PRIPA
SIGTVMLRHRTLIEVLGQVNSAEVTGAMLFNREGVLLAYNGYGEGNAANVSAALISSIWEAFDKKGVAGGREDLKEVVIMCEDGVLGATKVANMLLALKATSAVQPGILRAKMHKLSEFLDEPLTQISKNI